MIVQDTFFPIFVCFQPKGGRLTVHAGTNDKLSPSCNISTFKDDECIVDSRQIFVKWTRPKNATGFMSGSIDIKKSDKCLKFFDMSSLTKVTLRKENLQNKCSPITFTNSGGQALDIHLFNYKPSGLKINFQDLSGNQICDTIIGSLAGTGKTELTKKHCTTSAKSFVLVLDDSSANTDPEGRIEITKVSQSNLNLFDFTL